MIFVEIAHALFVEECGMSFLEQHSVFIGFDITVSFDGAALSIFLEAGDYVHNAAVIAVHIEYWDGTGEFPNSQCIAAIGDIDMGEFVLSHRLQYFYIGDILIMVSVIGGDIEALVESVCCDFQQGRGVVMLVFA
jgi:hypothetical protein